MGSRRPAVSDRWAARPALGAALRVLALLAPIAVGLAVAMLAAATLPTAEAGLARAGWWAVVLGVSAAAVFAADRLARRLLPLAILLELSLIFPDKAPSRLRAARTSSVRDLDRQLARLRGEGVPMEPFEAAETVVTLVGILGLHDKRTRGHSERVRSFTDLLTAELGLDEADRMRLRWAALVHDLGKLSVPAPVLNGAGKLDEDGWALMHRHPEEGERLLNGLLPWLGEWGDAVVQHHERWDGSGYPFGLQGEQISYAARIVALADSFEVMTSARSYKQAHNAAWARAELTRCAGKQFDPALVRAFLGISLGRLRWVLGPVTWLAELPFVATADRAGQTVKVASVTAMAAGLLIVGSAPGTTGDAGVPGSVAIAGTDGGATLLPRALRSVPKPAGEDAFLPVVEAGSAETLLGAPPVTSGGVRVVPRAVPGPGLVAPGTTRPGGSSRLPGGARPHRTGAGADEQAASGGTERDEGGAPQTGVAAPSDRDTGERDDEREDGDDGDERDDADEPLELPAALHLTRRGLVDQAPARQDELSVPIDSTVRFERSITKAEVLPAKRDLVLFVRFPTRQGNAKVAVRLLDCDRAACTELSVGMVTQDKRSSELYQPYVIPLDRGDTSPERLAVGRVLRLEVTVREPGAKGPARFALGSAATPSRLRLDR